MLCVQLFINIKHVNLPQARSVLNVNFKIWKIHRNNCIKDQMAYNMFYRQRTIKQKLKFFLSRCCFHLQFSDLKVLLYLQFSDLKVLLYLQFSDLKLLLSFTVF